MDCGNINCYALYPAIIVIFTYFVLPLYIACNGISISYVWRGIKYNYTDYRSVWYISEFAATCSFFFIAIVADGVYFDVAFLLFTVSATTWVPFLILDFKYMSSEERYKKTASIEVDDLSNKNFWWSSKSTYVTAVLSLLFPVATLVSVLQLNSDHESLDNWQYLFCAIFSVVLVFNYTYFDAYLWNFPKIRKDGYRKNNDSNYEEGRIDTRVSKNNPFNDTDSK